MLIKRVAILFLFLSSFVLILAKPVRAGPTDYRLCPPSDPCLIGEFLYDDEYTPIATASCTLTSRNPSDGLYLDDVVMDSQSDGWYSIGVTTASQTEGLYRSQMCCTIDTEYLCIDKSFVIGNALSTLTSDQVEDAVWDATRTDHATTDTFGENLQNSAALTASDVWDYPDRSLSSFGTLITDIWGYSSRSVNSVSSLVSSIWGHSDRELTNDSSTTTLANNTTTLVNQTDTLVAQTEDLSDEIAVNRTLLEQLVNKPIIETFIEEKPDTQSDFQSKVKKTRDIAESLSLDTKNLKQQVRTVVIDWDEVSSQLALSELSSTSRILGATTVDSEENEEKNIVSKISWLAKSWNNDVISHLSDQAASTLANTSNMSREIKNSGKTAVSRQYLTLVDGHLDKLGDAIGQDEDNLDQETLFGFIKWLEQANQDMIRYSQEIDDLFAWWESYEPKEIDQRLTQIQKNVLLINQVPQAEQILTLKSKGDKHRENLALALAGLIETNLRLLAQDADETVDMIWLEHGSIVFRSLVSNPSSTISQTVPIKYYLPYEVEESNIIKFDKGLSVAYDAEKDSFYVLGEIDLDKSETKTFSVEVEDIWVIPDDEISSLRKQADTLFEPLKGTSYFAQGSTIKADIDVNLDKIKILQRNSHTPETKIRAHRQAMVELDAAKSKLSDLKTLVASAGSIGTVFGFVGGVQTLAVWGLIVILIAGFVFLAIYMRLVSSNTEQKVSLLKLNKDKDEKKVAKNQDKDKTEKKHDGNVNKLLSRGKKVLNFKVSLGLLLGLVFSLFSVLLIYLILSSRRNAELISPISSLELEKNTLLQDAPDVILELEASGESRKVSEIIIEEKETEQILGDSFD
ncbi:MAG: hypothetical protein ABFQ62_00290 [Patescibacteria group bacterium]